MKTILLILWMFILCPFFMTGQLSGRFSEIRSLAMGGNEVTQSAYFNPSVGALYEKRQLSIHFQNLYGIKELNSLSGSLLYPTEWITAGIQFSSFGFSEYRQQFIRFLLCKALNESWYLGAAVQYSTSKSAIFEESPSILSTDIGLLYSPVDKLLIGLLVMNLPTITIKNKEIDNKIDIPYAFQLGCESLLINDLLIAITGTYNSHTNFCGNIGLEYYLNEWFHFRAGLYSRPFRPTSGVGIKIQSFSLDLGIIYHTVLGISTGLGLTYSF